MVGSARRPGPAGPSAGGEAGARAQLIERRARPHKEKVLNCPRCNSANTKFCYYNNYSLTQPRYFCKTCRRYWTEGGSLRNVPVGGGSRKNKRPSSAAATTTAATSTAAATTATSLAPSSSSSLITATAKFALPHISLAPTAASRNSKFIHEGAQDLNLAFPLPEFSAFPSLESSSVCTTNADRNSSSNANNTTNTSACTAVGPVSAMELLRSAGMAPGGGLVPFVPMPMPEYTTVGFCLPEFRAPPSLSFSLDGIGAPGRSGAAYGGLQGVQESRLLFPFEHLKPVESSSGGGGGGGNAEYEHNKEQGAEPPGFWNGMMGGGGSSWQFN